MFRRANEIIEEENREGRAGSVREEQARGAMVVLGYLLGRRTMIPVEREKWLGERITPEERQRSLP